MMTKTEFEFLAKKWEGVKGAAFNEVFEYCRCFGWCAGLDMAGQPVLTKRGVKAVKAFENKA